MNQPLVPPSHILIVDDERQGRELLESILSKDRFRLTFAHHGAQAVVEAQAEPPDLILMDVMMPEMTGLEACRVIRQDPKLADVPIILLTSMNDRQTRLEGIEAGADDFLGKPFDRIELRSRVRTITRLNRYRRFITERNKFEWVVEHAVNGYLLLDLDGVIQYANAKAKLLLHPQGDSQEPLAGDLLALVAPVFHCQPENAWADWPQPSAKRQPRYLVRSETRAAPALWLQVESLALPEAGYLVSLLDVSEEMNLHRLSCTFESLIAHKLRTPLSGLMVLSIVRDKIAPTLSEPDQKLLDLAVQSANRLTEEVHEILSYQDAGYYQNKDGLPVSHLSAICESVASELQCALHPSPWDDKVENRLMPLSSGDLQAVIHHLAANSVKFHPELTPVIEVSARLEDENTVLIQVRDDGCHLPREELAKVWNPYYQSEKAFTGEISGMGLGLAKVATIVWSVGGQCRMLNRPDRPGVIVELEMPLLGGE